MTTTTDLTPTSPSPTPIVVRSVGALAGLARQLGQSDRAWDLAPVKASIESVLGSALQAAAGQRADFEGEPADLIERYGTANLILMLSRLPSRETGKRLCVLLLTLQLIYRRTWRTEVDAAISLRLRPGLLELALSPSNRRLARRCLTRLARRIGLEGFRLDLLAMWRRGLPPISVRRINEQDVATADVVAFALLCFLIVASDLAQLARPLDAVARGLIAETWRRWDLAPADVRRAMSEALLLATDDRYTGDDLAQVVNEGIQKLEDWDRVGGLLIGFNDLCSKLDESFSLARFLSQLVYAADQLTNPESDPDHMRRLALAARRRGLRRDWRPVELDRPLSGGDGFRELADEKGDPQRSVPIWVDFDRALETLSPGETETFLRKLAGSPAAEIARRMGTSPEAVRVLQLRARRKLREALSEGRPRPRRRRAS